MQTTTTTTTVLWPLYRSTCVSRHLQFRSAEFCWCKFYCLHVLAHGNQHIRIREKTLEFSTVLSTLSLTKYCLRALDSLWTLCGHGSSTK